MSELRKYRYLRGFQRKFVADKCGITGDHLNDVEGARVNLTESVATKLSKVYGIEICEIKKLYKESKCGK